MSPTRHGRRSEDRGSGNWIYTPIYYTPSIPMSERSEKRRKKLTVAAALIYIEFLAVAIAVYVFLKDSDSLVMALYFVSSTLTLVTIIFAVLIMRSSPSEEYYEKYMKEKEEEERGR